MTIRDRANSFPFPLKVCIWSRRLACLCLFLGIASGATIAGPEHDGENPRSLPPAAGNDQDPPYSPVSFSEDWSQFSYTNRFLFHRLFHRSSRAKTYLTLGGLLAVTAVMKNNKADLQHEFREGAGGDERTEIASTAKRLGDAGTVPVIGLLLYLNGWAFKSQEVHESGQMVLESALYTALFTGIGQFVLSEQRPEDGGDLDYFTGRGHGVSGHASIAASIAAPLSRGLFRVDPDDGRWARFGKRVGTGFAYGLPVLTGLSRINDDKHYAWNVALGLAIGYAVGDTVADAHDSRREESEQRWIPDSIGPLVANDGAGLALTWRY